MGVIASQITSFTIVYSTVYSDADQRKHQSSASLAFVRGIHRGPVNSPHKWPVTRKCFHLMTSSCRILLVGTIRYLASDLASLQYICWFHQINTASIITKYISMNLIYQRANIYFQNSFNQLKDVMLQLTYWTKWTNCSYNTDTANNEKIWP